MRISIALCTYNGGRFLKEQLFSIQRQIRAADEIVACDDGSTDDTMLILQRFADQADVPVHIHRNERNLGSTRNFEKAIGLCRGDVIVTADQDDAWYPDKLLKIEGVFAEHKPALIFSDADLIDAQGRPLHSRLWASVQFTARRQAAVQRGDAFETLLHRSAVTGATMAFRANLRARFLPIPERWFHDEWIALVIAAGHRLYCIEQPLIQYRLHEANQVGVRNDVYSLWAILRQRIVRHAFLEWVDQFSELRERLARDENTHADRLTLIDNKAAHFRVRAGLPSSRLARLPHILHELLRLRYARYSGAARTSAWDLISIT